MLRIGDRVVTPHGVGTIDRTSSRTGTKLFRVSDRWYERGDLRAA